LLDGILKVYARCGCEKQREFQLFKDFTGSECSTADKAEKSLMVLFMIGFSHDSFFRRSLYRINNCDVDDKKSDPAEFFLLSCLSDQN
jgi:hypothetical protein